MHPSIERELAAIEADRAHGAAQLAERTLRLLAQACARSEGRPAEEFFPQMTDLVRRVRGLRPSMAAPGNWALAFYRDLSERLRAEAGLSPQEAGQAAATSLLAEQAAQVERLAEAAKPLLEASGILLTLSYSSTIEEVILRAAPPSCRVVVAEARPLLEGRRLIGRLRAAGRPVRCITDAQVGLSMRDADILLLGADTICSDLAAVNKVGSLPAALAARALDKPCAVAADTFKVSGTVSSKNVPLEEGPGAEVWEEEAGLCANVYFETVPADLIRSYITEKGVLSHRQMREEATRWERLYRAFPEAE